MGNKIFKTIESAIKYWYLPLIVGVLLIVLGIWTLTTPLNRTSCFLLSSP